MNKNKVLGAILALTLGGNVQANSTINECETLTYKEYGTPEGEVSKTTKIENNL
jgi:hypothetical protein